MQKKSENISLEMFSSQSSKTDGNKQKGRKVQNKLRRFRCRQKYRFLRPTNHPNPEFFTRPLVGTSELNFEIFTEFRRTEPTNVQFAHKSACHWQTCSAVQTRRMGRSVNIFQ